MSTDKLTIVPVSLDPLPTEVSTSVPSPVAAVPSCVIKTTFGEISLFNGVDEHIIHTIFKELKEL